MFVSARKLSSTALSLSVLWALRFLFPQILVAAPADTPAQVLERSFDSAKSALAAGDFRSAEERYRQTITIGLRQLGNLSISENQFARASELFDQALQFAPSDTTLIVDSAVASFRKGDVQKAETALNSVLRREPRNARAHNALGRLYLFNDDFE